MGTLGPIFANAAVGAVDTAVNFVRDPHQTTKQVLGLNNI